MNVILLSDAYLSVYGDHGEVVNVLKVVFCLCIFYYQALIGHIEPAICTN